MRGALWEGVLPGVLRHLYVGRKSGTLSFLREEERRSVRFRNGHIVDANTNIREDRMGEVLVRRGVLKAPDLKRAAGFVLRDKKRLGVVLMELGLLDKNGLEEAVALHVHYVLSQVFSWTHGSYEFAESEDISMEGDVTLRISTGELILQATRSVTDPDVIRYNLGDIDRILALSGDPLLRFQKITLTPADGYVFSRIDGTLSAREVLQLIPLPEEEKQRSLFGLLSTGVVEFLPGPPKARRASPPLAAGQKAPAQRKAEPPPAIELPSWPPAAAAEPPSAPPETIELPSWPPAGPEGGPPPTTAHASAPTPVPGAEPPPAPSSPEVPLPPLLSLDGASGEPPPGAAGEPATDPRRQEILDAYEALETRTHFGVLGIPRDATEAQVREAYFRLAKRFHPDGHHEATLSDLRDKLEAVFIRLGEAYEVLRNPRIRASYERELVRGEKDSPPTPATADPAREAEFAAERIHKAAQSILEERYWEGIQLLEPAIPRAEGKVKQEGRVLLARAYARNPDWVKQGEELLHTVVHEDPGNIDAYLVLAGIYRNGGLKSRASTMLRRVLELSPGHEEALAQLSALDPEGFAAAEKGGLIKKLLKKPGR